MNDNVITVDVSKLTLGLDQFKTRFDSAVNMLAETEVKKTFETPAKQNAPWTDRTARARQSLTGYVEKELDGYKLILSHGVDYGLWLELANEKNYAIVEPTVRLNSPTVLNHFKDLVNKL